jgi:N-acetylglucosamine kinase-like BadF-type ATPase
MRNLIMGIDGGGTKTLGVLYTEQGKELMRAEFGFSNFSMDEKIAKENIVKTVEALLVSREKDDHVILVMGISGASKIQLKETWLSEIEQTYQLKAELVTDAHIAIHSIDHLPHEHVIMAIGGTGSAVMMLEDGQTTLIGGYGYLLGDEGSAYHLVMEAIKAITKKFDAGKTFSTLEQALIDEMKVKTREDLVSYVYQARKTELAKLAILISKLSLASDQEAYQLLSNEGKWLAEQVIVAASRFKKDAPVRIALRGGFVLNAPYVKEKFQEMVRTYIQNCEMEDHPNEAVLGAYRLGIKKLSSEVTTW